MSCCQKLGGIWAPAIADIASIFVSPRSFCTELNLTVSFFYALFEVNGRLTLSLDSPLQTYPFYVLKFSSAFLLG